MLGLDRSELPRQPATLSRTTSPRSLLSRPRARAHSSSPARPLVVVVVVVVANHAFALQTPRAAAQAAAARVVVVVVVRGGAVPRVVARERAAAARLGDGDGGDGDGDIPVPIPVPVPVPEPAGGGWLDEARVARSTRVVRRARGPAPGGADTGVPALAARGRGEEGARADAHATDVHADGDAGGAGDGRDGG